MKCKYVKINGFLIKNSQALEIIKEKGVCLPALKLVSRFEEKEDILEEYNMLCIKYHCALPLTKEEFSLLKEVLL